MPDGLSGGRGRSARGGRGGLADRLWQHEADVLADHVELGDVAHAAGAEEVNELLDEVLRRARPRGDADHAPAFQPLLAYLVGPVDQMRLCAAVARDLDEAQRVGG